MQISAYTLKRAWHQVAVGSDVLDDAMLPPTGTSPDQYEQHVGESHGQAPRTIGAEGLHPARAEVRKCTGEIPPHANEYAEGARRGAPEALQVADRFQCAMRRLCAVRRDESKEVQDLLAPCRSRLVGAERSPTRKTPGKAGSSADDAGTAWSCQTGRVRRARSEGIREESAVKPRKRGTGSNVVDMGRVAVHSLLAGWADTVADLACRWGGHGESLRRNRGDAAGAKLDAGLIDRFTVNTGTIPYCSRCLDFLGFHHRKMESWKWRGRFYLQRWPSARAMRVLRDKVRAATGRSKTERPVAAVVAGLNPVLRGWAAYFRSGNSGRKFNAVDGYVHELLAVFASRETQTPRPELDHPVHLRIDYPARGLPPHRKRAQGDGACHSD
ncbi:group II intron maturase-specific domain-containing protein [Streptomyces sp. MMS24-I2-30]|uniref:group II intron maturase-specific domain-containing protein n=1 Tax=Streptomyces sp. MMS24-I2-30 TaxID=3351564 RepID=UPI003896EF1D